VPTILIHFIDKVSTTFSYLHQAQNKKEDKTA